MMTIHINRALLACLNEPSTLSIEITSSDHTAGIKPTSMLAWDATQLIPFENPEMVLSSISELPRASYGRYQ